MWCGRFTRFEAPMVLFLRSAFLQFPNPDIAVPNWIPVVLQFKGRFGSVRNIKRGTVVIRVAVDLYIVLNEHSIVQHGDSSAFDHPPILVELWRLEDDVIALPFARLSRSIDQRRILFVNRAG